MLLNCEENMVLSLHWFYQEFWSNYTKVFELVYSFQCIVINNFFRSTICAVSARDYVFVNLRSYFLSCLRSSLLLNVPIMSINNVYKYKNNSNTFVIDRSLIITFLATLGMRVVQWWQDFVSKAGRSRFDSTHYA